MNQFLFQLQGSRLRQSSKMPNSFASAMGIQNAKATKSGFKTTISAFFFLFLAFQVSAQDQAPQSAWDAAARYLTEHQSALPEITCTDGMPENLGLSGSLPVLAIDAQDLDKVSTKEIQGWMFTIVQCGTPTAFLRLSSGLGDWEFAGIGFQPLLKQTLVFQMEWPSYSSSLALVQLPALRSWFFAVAEKKDLLMTQVNISGREQVPTLLDRQYTDLRQPSAIKAELLTEVNHE